MMIQEIKPKVGIGVTWIINSKIVHLFLFVYKALKAEIKYLLKHCKLLLKCLNKES